MESATIKPKLMKKTEPTKLFATNNLQDSENKLMIKPPPSLNQENLSKKMEKLLLKLKLIQNQPTKIMMKLLMLLNKELNKEKKNMANGPNLITKPQFKLPPQKKESS